MTFLPSDSELLAHVQTWRSLRIEPRGASVALYYANRESAIGTIDVHNATLTVDADRDVIAPLLERHYELQATDDGVRLDVSGAKGLAAAEALLRRRLDLERFGWQLRVASP